MENIIDKIRTELRHSIDEKTLATSQNFFKEKIKLYGVKVPTVNKISREYFKLIDCKTKSEIVDYVIKNKSIMPRTALRYAIEKIPKELKIKAMER